MENDPWSEKIRAGHYIIVFLSSCLIIAFPDASGFSWVFLARSAWGEEGETPPKHSSHNCQAAQQSLLSFFQPIKTIMFLLLPSLFFSSPAKLILFPIFSPSSFRCSSNLCHLFSCSSSLLFFRMDFIRGFFQSFQTIQYLGLSSSSALLFFSYWLHFIEKML